MFDGDVLSTLIGGSNGDIVYSGPSLAVPTLRTGNLVDNFEQAADVRNLCGVTCNVGSCSRWCKITDNSPNDKCRWSVLGRLVVNQGCFVKTTAEASEVCQDWHWSICSGMFSP